MVYFKNLSRKATFNKVLRDKAFNIAQNLKYDGCKCGLFINTFGKKNLVLIFQVMSNQKLELHKSTLFFINNI